MARPCARDHDLSPEKCQLCRWVVTPGYRGRHYRRMWGEPEPIGDSPPAALKMTSRGAPCVHLGPDLGQLAKCTACRGRTSLRVFGCDLHRACTLEKQARTDIAVCATCADYIPRPNGPLPPTEIVAGLADPLAGERPDQHQRRWAHSPAVMDRHRKALAELASGDIPYSGPRSGDGIVLVGGGRYWPMITISLRMARQFTDLPIQVWYRGSDEPVNPAHIADLSGVTLRDLSAIRPRPRVLGGWEQKTTAILESGFRRVFYLDADAYLVDSPDGLFRGLDLAPFVFWQDLGSCAGNVKWPAMTEGKPALPPQVQGGQLLLDVRRAWRTLVVAHWMNLHSDYFYSHQYGDQDSWRVALALTGEPYSDLGPARWQDIAFVCHESGPRVVHRCRGKLWMNGQDRWCDALPGEADVRRHYGAVSGPPATAASVWEAAYATGLWGKPGTCGAGSSGEEAAAYLAIVNPILAALKVKSVADLGCGDGSVTAGLVVDQLHAVDCVASHSARVARAVPTARWQCLDLLAQREQLPSADAWIVKDVFHHWSNADLSSWLDWWVKSAPTQYCIATFDCAKAIMGADCSAGGYRALDPSQAPIASPVSRVVAKYLHKAVVMWSRPVPAGV